MATVIISILVLAIGISLMLSTVKSSFFWSGFFRKKAERQYIAESGIELMKQWIKKQGEPVLSTIDNHKVDGVLTAKELCNEPDFANFCSETNHLEPSVYLLAEPGNPPLNQGTKHYRLFSQVVQSQTNEMYTIETYVTMSPLSYARIAFGMLNPTGTRFYFGASTFDGFTYFGKFPAGTKPIFGWGTYNFNGPVAFNYKPTSSSDKPYSANAYANLNFNKGYKTDYTLDVDPNYIMDEVKNHSSYSVPADWSDPSVSELCLFVKDKVIERYSCTPDPKDGSVNHTNRYGSFISQMYLGSSGAVIYTDKTVEIKGIASYPFTIATDKSIRIGGDLIKRQQADSTYTIGLIAKENIEIPHYVPGGNIQGWGLNNNVNYVPDCRAGVGCTNFTADMTLPGQTAPKVIYEDRDTSNSQYPSPASDQDSWALHYDWKVHCSDPTKCKPNLPDVLDIEAAMFSVTGILDVETLNTAGGVTVYGKDGNKYSFDPAAPNYLYSSPGVRKAEPVYCDDTVSPCPVGKEMTRQRDQLLWITGGLLVNDYSSTGSVNCGGWVCGFIKKHISFDSRLLSNPPPGFPSSTTQVDLIVQWTKSYVGPANLSGNALATPTPTPTPNPDGGGDGGGGGGGDDDVIR